MFFLKNLNEKQIEVVCTTEGPVLVLAGAGSGKTKALTCRIAYLIQEKNISPENILAITFTNKAAKEMSDRVNTLISNSKFRISSQIENLENKKFSQNSKFKTCGEQSRTIQNSLIMGTFHSVCAKILRWDGGNLGIGRNFLIFDESDSLHLIKQIIKNKLPAETKISPQAVKSYISSAKNELLSPKKYSSLASGYFQETVAQIYPDYQKELSKNNALDFDDLLFETVRLFQEYPAVLKKYQDLWQYLLVDEYQDTNHAQYLFSKMLAERFKNICIVGDDWQSIYGFRGANFQNILDFEHDWPNAKVIKLEQNYRSTKVILSAAQNIIEGNENRSKKELWTENKSGMPISIYEAKNEEDEARFICLEVERLKSNGESLKNMAIFYRTNAQSRAVEEQLLRFKIPYKIVGGVRFYERREIRDLLAWLRLASGANDWVSFERTLLSPPSGIGKVSIEKLKKIAEEKNIEIKDLEKEEKISESMTAKANIILSGHFKKIEKVSKSSDKSLKDGIRAAIDASGLKEYFSDGSFANEERLENLNELLSVAEGYENLKGRVSLSEFLEEVALISDIDNYREDADGVTLMTLHVSKGLEFKIVFIVGLEENIFPHSRSLFEPAELEEERRLFYVGVTRARELLYLLYSRSRLFFGNRKSNLPSRFLTEIPEGLVNFVNLSSSQSDLEVPEERNPGFIKSGDKIEHENFGIGKVISVSDDEITVNFEEKGEKIISIYYAPIKKV